MATTTVEAWFTLSDGLEIYTQTWQAIEQPPNAYAFFLHGFSDHCNAYYEYFPTLASKGIEVFSFDQRGWGRTCTSKAQRGNTGPNSQILKDIDELLLPRLELAESTNTPIFLLGHSNGGGIALWYACYGSYRSRFAGVVLQSPLISLAPEVRPFNFVAAAGKLASKLFPGIQMVQKLNPDYMSRDKEVCRNFEQDELCHDTGTLIQMSDMLGRGKSLMKEEVYSLLLEGVPILMAHGSGDKVTHYDTSKKFTEFIKVKDKTFKTYDGWYHKLHAELGQDRFTFANDIASWILEHAQRIETAPPALEMSSESQPNEGDSAPVQEEKEKVPEIESKL